MALKMYGKKWDKLSAADQAGLKKSAAEGAAFTAKSKANLKKMDQTAAFNKQFPKINLFDQQQNDWMNQAGKAGANGLFGASSPGHYAQSVGGQTGNFLDTLLSQLQGNDNVLGGSSGNSNGTGWKDLLSSGGAALGTTFGGPLGGILGGLAGQGLGWLFGDEEKKKGPQSYEEALQELGGLPNENQLNFAPIKQNAEANFREQGIPEIAKRFGAMGGQRSSSFGQALSSGQQGLRRELAALEQGANLQNFNANQSARQAQQSAAMNLLAGNRGYEQNQQQLGQGQQALNLQEYLGKGKLDLLGEQNKNNLNQSLFGAGLQPRNQIGHSAPGQPFWQQALLASLGGASNAASKWAIGGL